MSSATSLVTGGVQQTLRDFWNMPITSWEHFFSPQVIFSDQVMFNQNSDDRETEVEVLKRVGSYGNQLSKIIDVIDLLVRENHESLVKTDKRAVERFEKLRDAKMKAVDKAKGRLSHDDVPRVLNLLDRLKNNNHLDDLEEIRRTANKLLGEQTSQKAIAGMKPAAAKHKEGSN